LPSPFFCRSAVRQRPGRIRPATLGRGSRKHSMKRIKSCSWAILTPQRGPQKIGGVVAKRFLPWSTCLLQLKRSSGAGASRPAIHRRTADQRLAQFPSLAERAGIRRTLRHIEAPTSTTVTGWLASRGFSDQRDLSERHALSIFSGTAGQVRRAFQTEIHNLEVKGERHIGNVNDRRIPAALAPVVAGVVFSTRFSA